MNTKSMLTRYSIGSLIPLVVSGTTLMATTAAFWPVEKPHKVHVTVFARTSSVRSSGGNRDVYLVQVRPKNGIPFYGRVVDEVPFYEEGVPPQLTSGNAPFTLSMWRNHACDVAADPGRMARSAATLEIGVSSAGGKHGQLPFHGRSEAMKGYRVSQL